jgi:hypothetical protein
MQSIAPTRYKICVHRARDGFYARVIELPGCVSHGASEVEAVERLRDSIRSLRRVSQLLALAEPALHLEISA